MGNGRKSAVELLRSLQDLLACDGCGVAFVASGNDDDIEEEDIGAAARRKPITLDCGHHICRSCGKRATAARKGFYEATCPAKTTTTKKDGKKRCAQRITAKDFAEEEKEEHKVNIKLVEIAHRAKELDTKLKEVRKEREGRNDDAEEEETTADEEKEEKKCGPRGDDAVSMWTLTAAFESEVLRTACESAMEIMGDPDTPSPSAGRERGDEEALFAKLEERRKANMTCASERERLEAIRNARGQLRL